VKGRFLSTARKTVGVPSLEDFEGDNELEAMTKTAQRLSRQLKDAKNRSNALVEVVYQAAYDAAMVVGVNKSIPIQKDKRVSKSEVALWHLTDWQGAKLTTSYNSQVMKERVLKFVHKAESITRVQRADHPVKDCTIMLGGDMVEGLFNFPTQPFEIDSTIFEQYVTVAMLLVDVVLKALGIYERVTVIAEWGNHGRIGSKRDAVPKSDNFDRMTYELARRLLAGEKRLQWEDCPEDIQKVEIGAYRALLMHGDEVGRAGFASPSAWQAAGNRWRAGAYKWDFQDIYLGHYHKVAQEGLSNGVGAIYWTGSTESDNRYARDSMAASVLRHKGFISSILCAGESRRNTLYGSIKTPSALLRRATRNRRSRRGNQGHLHRFVRSRKKRMGDLGRSQWSRPQFHRQ
jgi:hypothetical protein